METKGKKRNKVFTLSEAKQVIAEKYGKKDWAQINHEFEYGLGISKLLGFEELMDKVAELYKNKNT